MLWHPSFRLSIAARTFIALQFLARLALCVKPVVALDEGAFHFESTQEGWIVYTGYATWAPDRDPGFENDIDVTNRGFVALARDAYRAMTADAKDQRLGERTPSAMTAFYYDKKVWFASSVRKVVTNGNYDAGGLVKNYFTSPVNTEEDGSVVAGRSMIREILLQLLFHIDDGRAEGDAIPVAHQAICGEPVALEMFMNSKEGSLGQPTTLQTLFPPGGPMRMTTWGLDKNNQERVFPPCGDTYTAGDTLGCYNLLSFLRIGWVRDNPTPANAYTEPDQAEPGQLCIANPGGSAQEALLALPAVASDAAVSPLAVKVR